jgi:glycosyltransferase involved in cell wall biosynthesis
LLLVLLPLWHRKLRIAVVFHDAGPYPGTRWIDRVRRATQQFVMRRTVAHADRVIVPVKSEHLSWLRCPPSKVVFIPVGSNIPASPEQNNTRKDSRVTGLRKTKVAVVFGITPGETGEREMTDIRDIMEVVAKRAEPIRLCAVGRGTKEAEPTLRRVFETTGIEVSVLGLLPAAQISEILSQADVQIDVRSRISSRRGSVIAGIVCGTPVVGFESPDTDDAIRETGVVLVPPGDINAVTAAVTRILSDDSFRDELRLRNQLTGQKYFSWDAISDQLLRALRGVDHIPLS